MPWVMYYEPSIDGIVQLEVPNGTPLDETASTLGIIAMSMDQFPGIPVSTEPEPPEPESPDEC